jgi:hypothetical protein
MQNQVVPDGEKRCLSSMVYHEGTQVQGVVAG